MPLIQLSTPDAEPLTLSEAKNHLRVDEAFTEDDGLIIGLIAACREYAEHLTQTRLISQKWRYVLDAFPGPSLTAVPAGKPYSLPAHAILLPKAGVTAVDTVDYYDLGGTWRTMPAADYIADLAGYPPRITPVFGKIWPIPMPQIGSVRVDFTIGKASAADVPEGIKAWMKIRLDTLYNFRGENAVTKTGKLTPLPHVDRLLDPYRLVLY